MFAEGTVLDRVQAAHRWYDEEFAPVLRLIDEGGLRRKGETAADAYMRVAGERYSVFHDHDVEHRRHRGAEPPAVTDRGGTARSPPGGSAQVTFRPRLGAATP